MELPPARSKVRSVRVGARLDPPLTFVQGNLASNVTDIKTPITYAADAHRTGVSGPAAGEGSVVPVSESALDVQMGTRHTALVVHDIPGRRIGCFERNPRIA